jgi:hypothetical protein
MFACVIAKKTHPLRIALTAMIAFTMWFGGGLIPTFVLVRSLGFRRPPPRTSWLIAHFPVGLPKPTLPGYYRADEGHR